MRLLVVFEIYFAVKLDDVMQQAHRRPLRNYYDKHDREQIRIMGVRYLGWNRGLSEVVHWKFDLLSTTLIW